MGKKVLVSGAGPIGLMTMMSAKAYGASSVVITGKSTGSIRLSCGIQSDWPCEPTLDPERISRHGGGGGLQKSLGHQHCRLM